MAKEKNVTTRAEHLRVTSDEEKLVSLLCAWVLIEHGFRDSTLHPVHPLAKKSLKQLLISMNIVKCVSCIFEDGESIDEIGFLARSTKVDDKF